MKVPNWKFYKGFTLVELLVVIGISALAMAFLFPNFMGIRARARDTQRKRGLAEIQKALELYKLDQNPASYPPDATLAGCGNCWTRAGMSSDSTCAANENVYMKKYPCDPGSLAPTPFKYTQGSSDILTYTLSACLENAGDPDKDTDPVLIAAAACASSLSSYTLREP